MTVLDWESVNIVRQVIEFLMLLALAGYTYLGDKDKVTMGRLEKLESTLVDKWEDHSERISTLEAEVAGQPTHKDIATLYESINRLAATVNQLVGETKLQSDCLRMMINNMVNRRSSD